jgi:hypothetical protein
MTDFDAFEIVAIQIKSICYRFREKSLRYGFITARIQAGTPALRHEQESN